MISKSLNFLTTELTWKSPFLAALFMPVEYDMEEEHLDCNKLEKQFNLSIKGHYTREE